MSARAPSPPETAVFFRSGPDRLFGILTFPDDRANGKALLLVWGSGGLPSFGKNQVRARIARRLAGAGYHAFRIDYPGTGESEGAPPIYRMDQPVVPHVSAAADCLRARGLTDIILVGSCFGARTALSSVDLIPGITALVLLTPSVLDHTPAEERAMAAWKQGIAEPPEWASDAFLSPLERAVSSGIPVLIVYGAADGVHHEFERARDGRLGRLLDRAGDRITLRVVEGAVHAEPTVDGQEAALDVVEAWLRALDERGVGSRTPVGETART